MKPRQSFFLFLFSFFILLSSCQRSTEPIYNPQNLKLQVLDVSCTEAWLSLQAKSDYLNKTLKLFKNDSLLLEKTLTSEDSLLYLDGLWPNTSYQFQVSLYDGPKLMAQSATVTATTMDTTSHNFSWQTYEFGGQGSSSSSFYDVAIIDEDDIWAVGEINTTNGKYNAAHWDGEKWELKKIANDSYPRRVVYAFGKNDVWFDGSIKWDGTRYSVHMKNFPLLPNGDGWYKNAMWGVSSEDFYLVGDHGMIAHYDGQKWQRIESGTKLRIQDIYGVEGARITPLKIVAVASKRLSREDPAVLSVKGSNAKIISNMGLPKNIFGVWSDGVKWYVCGEGLFTKTDGQSWKLVKAAPYVWYESIRGNAKNDIFLAGSEVVHWNGLNWHEYKNELGQVYKYYYELAVKRDMVVAVGTKVHGIVEGEAVILVGKRNN